MLEPHADTLTAPPRARAEASQPTAAAGATTDAAAPSSPDAVSSTDAASSPSAAARDAAPAATQASPFVSVVIPCFNEERFIGQVLERVAAQYDAGRCEIVVVDGRSDDATRAVVSDFAARRPHLSVRLIDNPARHIPAALNLGIAAARGEIVARMDAHAVPSENYLRRCVELLGEDANAVVGAPCRIRAATETAAARAAALVVAHPFGIGDAQYRVARAGGPPRAVDTVPFGVFRKSLWQRLGGFDETLLANEDYDFNYRVRRGGGRVILDTAEHTIYYARPTLGALAAQYARYGRWKAQMLRSHPRSVRWRHAVAPAFVAGLASAALAGLFWRPAWWLLVVALGAYLAPALAFAVSLARRAGDGKLVAPVLAAFFVVHFAWGTGFWRGLLGPARAARGGD